MGNTWYKKIISNDTPVLIKFKEVKRTPTHVHLSDGYSVRELLLSGDKLTCYTLRKHAYAFSTAELANTVFDAKI